ncbi:MAG TPA: hypothetical protein VK447_01090 [Myxococcaceae bacterium]|nr:hypothetical protein [Myxococcaceae bacterium]
MREQKPNPDLGNVLERVRSPIDLEKYLEDLERRAAAPLGPPHAPS